MRTTWAPRTRRAGLVLALALALSACGQDSALRLVSPPSAAPAASAAASASAALGSPATADSGGAGAQTRTTTTPPPAGGSDTSPGTTSASPAAGSGSNTATGATTTSAGSGEKTASGPPAAAASGGSGTGATRGIPAPAGAASAASRGAASASSDPAAAAGFGISSVGGGTTVAARTLPGGSRLRIPSIGVDAAIVTLGVDPDGTMQVPNNGNNVGWYTFSAPPGTRGNAVLSGHLDTATSPVAVFSRLKELRQGDALSIVEDGTSIDYSVFWTKAWPDDTAPLALILGNAPSATLTLITCSGTFDHAARNYSDRLVVRAKLPGTV